MAAAGAAAVRIRVPPLGDALQQRGLHGEPPESGGGVSVLTLSALLLKNVVVEHAVRLRDSKALDGRPWPSCRRSEPPGPGASVLAILRAFRVRSATSGYRDVAPAASSSTRAPDQPDPVRAPTLPILTRRVTMPQ